MPDTRSSVLEALNYAAAGAHYLSKKFSLKRVAIVDLDADHGVGTQEIFWERRDVLTVSLHRIPRQD